MQVNPQILFSAVAVIAGVPAIVKILFELPIVRRTRMREEYKFAKEFLAEVESNEQMHPYLKEKGYQTIAGVKHLTGDEIAYLLLLYKPVPGRTTVYLHYPDRALLDYSKGQALLTFNPDAGDAKIAFKEKYASQWSRFWRKSLYVSGMFIFWIIAFLPLIIAPLRPKTWDNIFELLAVCMLTFGPYAYLLANAAKRIVRAEHLIAHQHERMTRTIPAQHQQSHRRVINRRKR